MSEILLTVKNLKKYYPVKRGLLYKTVGWVKAIDDVSFSIAKGKTLGLVGESGCGKTTTARVIARLIEADSGHIYFSDKELNTLSSGRMRLLRKDLQIIFQDPFNSLDPRFSVAQIIQEGLLVFGRKLKKKEKAELLKRILKDVGLSEDSLYLYPHEFSGGQRQRISIARSLILSPKLLILDEPVSSLDVSIQAQIINLLLTLQERLGLTYLFIAHDLNVVRCVSDEVCVMYLGKIVERASTFELFRNPLHPYTKLLLSASPKLGVSKPDLELSIKDKGLKLSSSIRGCSFRERCLSRQNICKDSLPELIEAAPDHCVSCHLFNKP